jgi:mono/diheme cytochrome c family protein
LVRAALARRRTKYNSEIGERESQREGHCGMCHTPKNFLGGDKDGQRLQGYALQGWFAPNITNDSHLGLGSWLVDDIVAYLKTGHNKFSAATGPMSETLNLSTSNMSDSDLKAIAVYLKDQSGQQQSASSDLPWKNFL